MPQGKYDLKPGESIEDHLSHKIWEINEKIKSPWLKSPFLTNDLLAKKRQYLLDIIYERGRSVNPYMNFSDLERRLSEDKDCALVFEYLVMNTENMRTDAYINTASPISWRQFQIILQPERLSPDSYANCIADCIKQRNNHYGLEQKLSDYKKHVLAREEHAEAKYIRELKDSSYPEGSPDPFADDKDSIDRTVMMAASLVAKELASDKHPLPSAEECNFDLDIIAQRLDSRAKTLKTYTERLEKDLDFRLMVKTMRYSGYFKSDLSSQNLFSQWKKYSSKRTIERIEYTKFKNAGFKDPENKYHFSFFTLQTSSDALLSPVDPYANDLDDDETSIFSDQVTKDNLKTACKHISKDIIKSKSEANGVIEPVDFVAAANLVIADTLLSPAAEKTFFSNTSLQKGGNYSVGKANDAINIMRDQLINDPIFMETLTKRLPAKDFVNAYKAEIKKEVNQKISLQENKEKEYSKNITQSNEHKRFVKEHNIELKPDELDDISKLREQLAVFNKGKKPSAHMLRLTNALDRVMDQSRITGNRITVEAIEELHNASLNYYAKRQGIFFAPIHDNGKSRLATVEKLVFKTDTVMDRCRKLEKDVIEQKKAKTKA